MPLKSCQGCHWGGWMWRGRRVSVPAESWLDKLFLVQTRFVSQNFNPQPLLHVRPEHARRSRHIELGVWNPPSRPSALRSGGIWLCFAAIFLFPSSFNWDSSENECCHLVAVPAHSHAFIHYDVHSLHDFQWRWRSLMSWFSHSSGGIYNLCVLFWRMNQSFIFHKWYWICICLILYCNLVEQPNQRLQLRISVS